ncbi:MAG: flagellar biosynthesis protein FlhB [Alphaproteobacteria bacterium]|nr:flagellar biosynthesis protein FlhB [Rhodospirillales bacterium]MCW9046098.1 flagellar biosynthesis protein FlhB [Alphaproteobacteria bacterium]
MSEDQEKTEEPTSKKLDKARTEGQVLQSSEVKNWGVLLGASFSMFVMGPWIMGHLKPILSTFLESPHAIRLDTGNVSVFFSELIRDVGLWTSPIFLVAIIVAFATNVGVSGLVYSPKKMAPKLNRLDPIKGTQKIISLNSIFEFVKDFVKLCIVGIVVFTVVMPMFSDLTTWPGLAPIQILDRMGDFGAAILVGTTAVLTVLAFFDFFYQKYTFIKKLKMSKQEVKDENKNTEGDPQIKGRLRRIRMERARTRMMANVPDASVIVTNPTHYSVALAYSEDDMAAPTVVAKGVDSLALKIREVAEEADVPIVENPPLARALYATVELEEEIPEEHYKPVAEVIGYVMRLKGGSL